MAITLAKGQGLSLEKSQHNLSLVTIGLGWDIAEKKTGFLGGLFGSQSAEYDLDVVAFLCDADGKVRDLGWDGAGNATLRDSDVIFFNNLFSTGSCSISLYSSSSLCCATSFFLFFWVLSNISGAFS